MDSKDEAKNLLLGKNARILVSDGRVVSGEIVCVDNEKNVILLDATELRGAIHPDSRQSAIDSKLGTSSDDLGDSPPAVRPLRIGQVLVPGTAIIQLQILRQQ